MANLSPLSFAQSAISTPEQGFRVLLAAVIFQAERDATGEERSGTREARSRRQAAALVYFNSVLYRHHCQLLGVQPVLPPAVAAKLVGQPKKP